MITLDLDLSYLSRYYNIGSNALAQYQGMSISEIMQTEAEKGNIYAAKFMMEITHDPEKLAVLFQLAEPHNRFLLLSNMNKDDLMKVMLLLEPEQMILGLSIFNQEVLVNLMMQLEPESLATVVLEKMGPELFLKKIPEEFMDEFLSSEKINRNMFMKALENIDEEQLQKMMENYTGQACYENRDSILQTMSSMNDDDFLKAMFAFEPEGKQEIIMNLLQQKPDLFEEFSPEAMTYPFKFMDKEEVLKSLSVLKTEEMMPMVEKMPQELMAMIATQIDPMMFAEVLSSDFADIIANCGINLG